MNIIHVRQYNEHREGHAQIKTESGKPRQTGWMSLYNGIWEWFPNLGQARNYRDGYRKGIRIPENKM